VSALLEAGARIDSGTAVHPIHAVVEAAKADCCGVLEAILTKYPASIQVCQNGENLAEIAYLAKNYDIVKLLEEHGLKLAEPSAACRRDLVV
jgi:hypothetical protein